jgi:hypothetical protein
MLNEQIESVMRSALLSTTKSHSINLKDVRIKMVLTSDWSSVDCFILNKVTEIEPISWGRILGMKAIFKGVIIDTICNSLKRLGQENNVDLNDINARIYAIDEKGTPNIYLYNGVKPLKKINLSEII